MTQTANISTILVYKQRNSSPIAPCCTERVQEEIDRVIGQARLPSMADQADLPYTDAVIHEIQRMANIVPLSLPHMTTRDVQLGGYTVPKVSLFLTK